MVKYGRICCLCCSTLDLKNCLLTINDQYSQSQDISDVDNSHARLCKTCYCTVFEVQKAKDKLRKGKRELKVFDVQMFFSSSKRVRGLSAPIEGSPST